MMLLPLRVIVADDHRLFRQGLIGLMRTRRDLVEVVGEAATGQEVIRLAQTHHPDVILMDIQMPDADGLEAAARIHQLYPEIAIVMLTASELDEHLYKAVQVGAVGYLLKSLDADELFTLLEGVALGEAAMTRAMAARLLKRVSTPPTTDKVDDPQLSEREVEVLRLVAQGASNPQIADELCITVNTVKVHLRNILDKLRVENRAQAAVYAVRSGLVPLAESETKNHPVG